MTNLLLNALIIIVCIFIYYMFLLNPRVEETHRKWVIGTLSLLAITLCMQLPYYDGSGTTLDLRAIPLLIGTLYGGRKVALTLCLGVIAVRFLIGFDIGVFSSTIQVLFFYIFAFYTHDSFNLGNFKKKLIFAFSFILGMWFLNYGTYFILNSKVEENLVIPLLLHLTIVSCSLLLTLYLMEYSLQNAKIKEEIMLAEKLRVVNQLAASVSHEVRNPLTVTRGFLQLLKEENIPYDKRKRYLDYSLLELDRAQTIITNYLAYAKPNDDSKLETLNIADELNYLHQVLMPYAIMKGVEIIVHPIKDGTTILGSKEKFRQSLMNIAKNGIEAMQKGGELIFEVVTTNSEVKISIQDTGIGMTKDELKQLGKPLLTTKKGGTGLGAMSAIHLIKSMNGKVTFKSRLGIGTTFTVIFPKIKSVSL